MKHLALIFILAAVSLSVADTTNDTTYAPAEVTIRFVYNHCNDLEAMRHFYSDLLGMTELGFNLEWNWLGYQCDGFQLCFFGAHNTLPVPTEFTDQPGYQGGDLEGISWSIEIPEARFAETVNRLQEAGVPCFSDKPQLNLDSYWGFSVLDPMGVTVEVFCFPEDIPESAEWPDM